MNRLEEFGRNHWGKLSIGGFIANLPLAKILEYKIMDSLLGVLPLAITFALWIWLMHVVIKGHKEEVKALVLSVFPRRPTPDHVEIGGNIHGGMVQMSKELKDVCDKYRIYPENSMAELRDVENKVTESDLR